MNPVMGLLLNIFLPWDYFWAYLAVRFRSRLAVQLPVWLERLYQLEALISLADYSRLQVDSSYPVIDSAQSMLLQVEQLAHPLLPPQTRVANNFSLEQVGEVALITGSNMAGKSTFIKAVGINLCLAYAGAAVLAASWRSQPLRLHSCIRISDSIGDGFSYFFAEVKCLSRLLHKLEEPLVEAAKPFPVLYLIDEIFRGTNNRERLIGSRAYLQAALKGNGSGLVATHDLELATLAKQSPRVKNYHFRDRVEDGRLVFDFIMRGGASPTTNALRIMALEGLPVDPGDDDPFN
jgi:DNA mismatch repair ATPase MutS